MDAEQDRPPLEGELRELEVARAADREAERRNTIVTRIVASTLLVIVVVFTLINYRHIKLEWTQERLEASLRKELDTLNVAAMGELDALGEHLLPVYADEALRQFQDVAPEVAQRFSEQFERVGEDLQAETRAQLSETEDRIRVRTAQLMFEAFPELANEATRVQVEQRLHATTDGAVTEALELFDARFSGDVHALQGIVMSFDISDTDEATVDMQKRFLRCWLQLLDKEIEKL